MGPVVLGFFFFFFFFENAAQGGGGAFFFLPIWLTRAPSLSLLFSFLTFAVLHFALWAKHPTQWRAKAAKAKKRGHTKKMFHSSLGVFQATEGLFCATDTAVPDELRVVVASLAPTSSVNVRVLTAGVSNDVHDYHSPALLASKVTVSVTDAEGSVAATLVSVAQVTVASGTYVAYALTLARAVLPTEISSVSVLSPYVTPTLATTSPLALTALAPRVELALAESLVPLVPWAPSAALGVTAPAMPAGHKLVVGSSVTLRFAFDAPEPFAAGAAASFAATVNGADLSLASATVDGAALLLAVTASSVAKHTFVFVAFGTVFVFVVEAAKVYVFPTIVGTARSVPVVTLGAELVVTSSFGSAFPGGATATAVVTATGQSPVSLAASVSGTAVSVAHTVAYDVAHAGVVTVAYGSTSAEYSWGAGALTAAHIYTFPSTFAYSTGAYGTGLNVRQGISSALTLTFSGGDLLHSSVVSAQVEYVNFAQGSTESNASIVACSDPLETVDVTLTPQATTDLTLRVKLRGPDGTLSAEITRVVPSAEIAPDWLPTSVASVASDVPVPHKLVVGSAARLAFALESNGDLSSAALAEFTMYVDGSVASLTGATVSGRTLSVSYSATSIASRTFEFRARGQSASAVVGAIEVYAFPSVASTAKGTPVVTLGTAVTLTTTFGASLPALMAASLRITPSGYGAETVSATPSASEVAVSYTVVYDVAHSALVSLIYGPATQEYAWSTSALTAAEIYTFPSAFAVSGWLHQLTSRALTLTFSGGDLLHSSVLASQVSYVKYVQGASETTVAASGNSCSASAETVTLGSVAPALLVDVALKVALRAPDGTVGPELTRTILASAIAPQWVPTASGSVASNVPSPHKLVVGSEVQLTFSFVSSADFPSTDASALFSLRVDGAVTSLAGAVVSTTARTVRIAYTSASAVAVAFEFATSYGSSQTFTVASAEVYTFPTMSSTSRGVSVVSLGQTLALTSNFSAALPAGTTAAVSIVPTGYAAATPAATVSGTTVTYSVSVAYDVVHTGTVTLTYGAAQRNYSWAAGTMTAAHIYTFPSSFTYTGTANGYGGSYHLKESTAGSLTLTFTGGDLLHSSVVATQVEYAKFTQSGATTTISSASLACSDPLETVTVSSLTPASTAELTLKVKLRGPDGALSSEITAVVPSAQIAVSVQTVRSIYATNLSGTTKTGGYNADSLASSLVLAVPGDALLDVSASVGTSSSTKTVTVVGSANVSSARSKYYGQSLAAYGWVSYANTGFKITGMPSGFLYGDWTFEGWYYNQAWGAGLFKLGHGTANGGSGNTTTNPTVRVCLESLAQGWLEVSGGAVYQGSFSCTSFPLNQWVHVAVVRRASPSGLTLYANGTLVPHTINNNVATKPTSDPGTTMFLGCMDDLNLNSSNVNGYMQDARFYTTAKYTQNFTVT